MTKPIDELRSVAVAVRLRAEEVQKLDDICAKTGETRSSCFRRLLKEAHDGNRS